MKSTFNRFLALSVVLITALAFVNSDCQQTAQAQTQGEDHIGQSETDFVLVSEKDLKATEGKDQEDSKELFRFPNVFDAFRSIF